MNTAERHDITIPSRPPAGRRARRIRLAWLLATLTLAGVAVTASSALANQARVYTGSFGAATSTPNPDPYPLAEPFGVAVDDSSGDVYVADPLEHRVEKFTATGDFILMFGKEVDETTKGDVCTAVSKDTCGPGAEGSTPGAFEGSVLYVAVDNSAAGASKGDVYVGELVENEDVLLKEFRNHVQKFNSSGELISSWGTGGELNGSGIVAPPANLAGPFGPLKGIAVDSSGDLWVYGTGGGEGHGSVFEFAQEAKLLTDWTSGQSSGLGIAVSAEKNVYLVASDEAIVKYTATGELVGPITEPDLKSDALAVAPSGNVYVGTGLEGDFRVLRYGASCEIRPLGGGCVPEEEYSSRSHLFYSRGIAVGGGTSEPLYAAENKHGEAAVFASVTVPGVVTGVASGFGGGSAVLNGTVNPSGVPVGECVFEWGETTGYGHVAACEAPDAAEVGSGTGPVAVSARVSGLKAGVRYHFRLVAANANDATEPVYGADSAFGPPVEVSGWVTEVSTTAATFGAGVNPDSADTHVQVEYGLTEGYGKETEAKDAGAGTVVQDLAFHVQQLVAETVYYYRVLANSVLGAVATGAYSFRTQHAASETALLDGRQWELVSPADKHGADLQPINSGERLAIQAAAGGGAMTFLASAPTEAEPAGNADLSQILATRGPGGWDSRDVSIPHREPTGSGDSGEEYRVFSSDLTEGLLQPFGEFEPGLSGEASEQTLYLRRNFPPGEPVAQCPRSCFEPLVSGAAGFENVPAGTVFGVALFSGSFCPPEPLCGPQLMGETPDLSHVVMLSSAALTEEHSNHGGLFEWSGGRLALVSVLPSGAAATLASNPSLGGLIKSVGVVATAIVTRHSISANGNRVVWSEGKGHLYLRDVASEVTVQLDKAQGVGEPAVGGALFQDASADGSRVFFTDAQQLVKGAGAPDLYECEIVEEEGAGPKCRLSDLTPAIGGESADVQESVIGASEDGSSVYFAANGVLTRTPSPRGETAVHGDCGASEGLCNLYVVRDGVVALVAVVSDADSPDWGLRPTEPLPSLTGRVSGDGRWFAFMSDRELTGYDNQDARSGQPDEEVYLYHAGEEGEGGGGASLVCASCDPTGARPYGVEYSTISKGLAGGYDMWGENQWLAGSIPGWTSPRYQSRYLSDGGRLFFDSSDALVPQDQNHTEDVYEYEPPAGQGAPAANSCTAASSRFVVGEGGCVGLVSSGESAGESAFLDASENGEDVFFLTTSQLVGQDTDKALDIYDAHVCTSSSPCPPEPGAPEPPCVGDSCQGSVEPPNDATPGSLSFHGPGNQPPTPAPAPAPKKTPEEIRAEKLKAALRACRKDKRKVRRVSCERQAKAKYGPIKPKPKKAKKPAKKAKKAAGERPVFCVGGLMASVTVTRVEVKW